ncbi:MAG: 30S ribosomal protein S20 [bacterium]
MANLKSSIKDIRRTKRRTARNLARLSRIESAVKAVKAALQEASSLLDRAARKEVIHWRAAGRKKSRLAAYLLGKFPKK